MLTFEQLKPMLYKWAAHYRGMGFEPWELINEVWLRGDVQKLDNIQSASAAVRCDMVDYIRDETSNRRRQRWEKRGRNFPNFTPISSFVNEDGSSLVDGVIAKQDYDRLESRDLFNVLTKGFDRREKLIVRLIYEYNFNQTEVAKVIGTKETRISQLHTNILARLKQKLLDMGIVDTNYTKPYKYRREPDNLRFYNRTYYQENKVYIQAQRKAQREKIAS